MADLDSCRAAYSRELAATRARYRRALHDLALGLDSFSRRLEPATKAAKRFARALRRPRK